MNFYYIDKMNVVPFKGKRKRQLGLYTWKVKPLDCVYTNETMVTFNHVGAEKLNS